MASFHPVMTPHTGSKLLRFVGDRILFRLRRPEGQGGAIRKALLRTTLGCGPAVLKDILHAHAKGAPAAGAAWRDIPMVPDGTGWKLDLVLAETGFFKAKAYLLDERGWQHWPEGPDVSIAVHPDQYRTANIIYCAFPRMFGRTRAANRVGIQEETAIRELDVRGYSVIPASGKLRDLTREIPHIVERLGCRIVHLLPINPVPTTYARFGRFGSPYAALDLSAVDPALIEFDKRSTGIDQFRELSYAAHLAGARIILDIVVNHTGWGSSFQEQHPEWFLRSQSGEFKSPGAWGTTWEDLVELNHSSVELWDHIAQSLLTWCRRGVDGFRCDAGYMVPLNAWQYIIARVRQEYPEALFLLEGLGGAWELTEALLGEGGMQWAYSELFQNYSVPELTRYLEHSSRKSAEAGLLVHYSETHDNNRLAAKGRQWSLLRNRLCALASCSGAFGFTCGVEWLATEKIRVHGSSGMNWDAPENIIPELAKLNRLLAERPCFFDGATVELLSRENSEVLAFLRTCALGSERAMVLVNPDTEKEGKFELPPELHFAPLDSKGKWRELLGQKPLVEASARGTTVITVPPGGVFCFGTETVAAGDSYRLLRSQSAFAVNALRHVLPVECIGPAEWTRLAALVNADPRGFLSRAQRLDPKSASSDLIAALGAVPDGYPQLVEWAPKLDARRVTMVPLDHWLVVTDQCRFRASLQIPGETPLNLESTSFSGEHIAALPPRSSASKADLFIERYPHEPGEPTSIRGSILYIPHAEQVASVRKEPTDLDLLLLTNGRGGMARIALDLGRVRSKYDCLLAANLHPDLPVDRHVFVKRIRVWVDADGFLTELNGANLERFRAGSPGIWHFVANAGGGRTVEIDMRAAMPEGRNTTVVQFSRPSAARASGKQLEDSCDVRLTVRLDIEDRGFHSETLRNGGAEAHFSAHTRPLNSTDFHARCGFPPQCVGFEFTPAADRQLRAYATRGAYHSQPEWSTGIPHPLEQSRGQVGHGDAYSPGWFELPLGKGTEVGLIVTAETNPAPLRSDLATVETSADLPAVPNSFSQVLARAIRAFVVRRGEGKTVIAGYPWFLDWGRDTFIAARGMIAAGMLEDVRSILRVFARFEDRGTLPNTIFGENASNRDTADAPLWFACVCEELLEASKGTTSSDFLSESVDEKGRTLLEVLESIADHYARGTPNGIRMDPASSLIWSPAHFTWMDTNYPAGTPREGFPIEIQALWIRFLRFLSRMGNISRRESWRKLADRALESVEALFWFEDLGYYSDVLQCRAGQEAASACKDDALRSNALFMVSLGLTRKARARRQVAACGRHLLVPGGLRSLAPLPVKVPLHIRNAMGGELNNPVLPYWGRYEGDEDTRRKPAYHNGTAWVWTLPTFCEALAMAWDFQPSAVRAAHAYLLSLQDLLLSGCIGQLPEVLDGDAPHWQRGCDAQAWSVTEALRVHQLLLRPIAHS